MMQKSPELVVLDIDGVLTGGEANPFDLAFMGTLAELNRAARQNPANPGITICSGRPAPYVEAIMQAIDCLMPAVYENGAGIYVPETYQFLPNPMGGDMSFMIDIRRRLEDTIVADDIAYFQPGKEFTITLFCYDEGLLSGLHDRTRSALGAQADQVSLQYSTSCLNILPKQIDKGVGIRFLSEKMGISTDLMLGVGDSEVDLSFLETVGLPAAPSNANPEVKELAQFVASMPTHEGVREILTHFGVLP